jgi:RimJ/RimL family protein N-acetyltransferase
MIIETKRLYLRYFVEEDYLTMYEYRSDKECGKYQLWKARTIDTIKAFLKEQENKTLDDNELQIAIIKKDGDVHIGDIYYCKKNNTITLGYTISPKHQRQGYAFEMISSFIEYLHQRFPECEFVAMIHEENIASYRLLEKLGFNCEGFVKEVDSIVFSKYTNNNK